MKSLHKYISLFRLVSIALFQDIKRYRIVIIGSSKADESVRFTWSCESDRWSLTRRVSWPNETNIDLSESWLAMITRQLLILVQLNPGPQWTGPT